MQRIFLLLFLLCFKVFGGNKSYIFTDNLSSKAILNSVIESKSLIIYYGTKNEGLNIQKYPYSKKIEHPEFNNSFQLENLAPETEYYFVVQSSENELNQYTFKTGSLNKEVTALHQGNADFTVIALPDTQHYTWRSNTFQIFIDQTQWIVNQKVNLNIVLVDHLGDIVDYSEPVQWQRARLALDFLNQNDIAIGVAPGNHDYDTIDAYTGQATLYDKNFPATTAISVADGLGIPSYEQYDWYGGYMGGTNDVVTSDDGVYTNRLWKNNYVLFSAGGMDFINIALEFNFPFETQQWLDDVLTAFPNRRAIISTHQFLRDNNTITSSGNVQAVLNNILAEHCNVFLILCAHNHDGDTPGVAELNLQNSCGKPVYIRMSNYQEEENGGDGYLRIMKFHPSKSTIDFTTYSPVLNQYKTDAYNQFTLQYDMSASTPITFDITSPEDHSVFDIGTTNITVSANTSSIVDYVEFKLNGQTFVDSTSSNGIFSITTSGSPNWLPEGTYTLEVIAHDNETSTTLTKSIVITIGTLSKVLDVRIGSSNNDAEEFVWNGSVNLTSSDLELYSDEGNPQQVGLRFQNISIPRGATITNAYIEFTVDELNSGTFSMKVSGEAADNSAVFNASQYNISNRTKTNNFVNWSPDNWVAENDLHRTPNLSTIIQEITDRNGWNTGNSMSFIVHGASNPTSTRVAEAYDGETFSAPLLHVEYTLGNCQTRTFYADLDNDGYGNPNNTKTQCTLPPNYVENNLDCDDNNATVNPNAFEIAFNNIDDDCNPATLDNPTGIELEITSPSNNYIFNQGTSNINISATTNSVVDYVEFKLNGQTFTDNNNSDTTFSVNATGNSGWLPTGNYTIEVIAYDVETSNSLSKQLNITIGPIFGNIDVRVNGTNNDAEENLFNNGSIDLGSSDLELYTESGVDPQQIGLRFQNLSIPKNATITNAYIEFTVDEVTSGNVTVNISGEAIDNSLAFQNTGYNISSRTKTVSVVAWNPSAWINENDLHQTPNLKDLVQEIVNRTGWSSGNSMSFILFGGNVPTNTRVAESYDGETFSAPLLHIEYAIGACNAQTYYADNDHDGFGDATSPISDCTQPLNYVTNNSDCDDTNASINASSTEIPYNGIDDDCNPLTKDDDLDGDGFILANDCDDTNALVNASATEIPYNGIDDDCNPLTKDDDLDGDGFTLANDCDDSNASINASATEIPYNGIDDDCNPLTKDDDLDGDGFVLSNDCDDSNALINASATEIPYNGIDDDCNPLTKDDNLDGDGFILANDCDDSNALINASATEIQYNGIDDDCNPSTKDDDLDGDGFTLANDCDDSNALINASATEIPYNGIDDDCNPLTKDDDLDGDGFVLSNDCDDSNALINASATEIQYNGIDDDCNPTTKDDDLDGDGFTLANDCDDSNASINASATEIQYNGIDDDCNPTTKDDHLDGDGFILANDCDDSNALINASATEIQYNGIDDDCNPSTKDDDLDGDGFTLANDCDDSNALINASATEIPYNGIDDDCNPLTKDDDLDGDGFILANDCDDSNALINASATEIQYNGIDDDCNPLTKDDDLDGDGFVLSNDCDDSNALINASATEIPYNGIDDDCNPTTKDDDLDGDGFILANDCDDSNALINASSTEIPYNGIDDDCNPTTKDDDLDGDGFILANDCDDSNALINASATEIPYNGIDDDCNPSTKDDDLDGDGFILANDCDDNNPNKHELFSFYLDSDSDGVGSGNLISNICAVNATTPPAGYSLVNTDCEPNNPNLYRIGQFYIDVDGDNYSASLSLSTVCFGSTIPSGYKATTLGIDCNDNNPNINPGKTEILYDGIDNNCDGILDAGFQITTTMKDCGTTLPTISTNISCFTLNIQGIDGYRFEITNTSSNQVQTIDRTVQYFNMTQLASYDYSKTYSIRVMLRRNGIWLGYYGPACLFSTPAVDSSGGTGSLQIQNYCGQKLPTINTAISTTSLPGATGYKFRVINTLTGATLTLVRSLQWFTMTQLSSYNYGTKYIVDVAVKTTGDYTVYGTPCEITTPDVPTLVNFCNTSIPSKGTSITTTSLPNVTAYKFEITRYTNSNLSNIVSVTELDRTVNWFTMNMISNYSPNTYYGVRVKVMSSGSWSPWGNQCYIISPATSRISQQNPEIMDVFNIKVYPNPYENEFYLNIESTSTSDVVIRIYDAYGKLIEDRNVPIIQVPNVTFGSRYSSGVYNIIVTQDNEIQSLKLIKK